MVLLNEGIVGVVEVFEDDVCENAVCAVNDNIGDEAEKDGGQV